LLDGRSHGSVVDQKLVEPDAIQAIRTRLVAIGSWSHTSAAFQNQILSFIRLNAAAGDFVIEVGCFRGGLTAQIAYTTHILNKAFYTVDINRDMLDVAAEAVRHSVGTIPESTHFHAGDLKSLLTERSPQGRCILLFIDGDHRYAGVVADIRAVLQSTLPRPLTLAFHDYSLRSLPDRGIDVRIGDAIRDELGPLTLYPIGDLAGLSDLLRCEPDPRSDGTYHQAGRPEGVMMTIP
jgi:hypothetical protein